MTIFVERATEISHQAAARDHNRNRETLCDSLKPAQPCHIDTSGCNFCEWTGNVRVPCHIEGT